MFDDDDDAEEDGPRVTAAAAPRVRSVFTRAAHRAFKGNRRPHARASAPLTRPALLLLLEADADAGVIPLLPPCHREFGVGNRHACPCRWLAGSDSIGTRPSPPPLAPVDDSSRDTYLPSESHASRRNFFFFFFFRAQRAACSHSCAASMAAISLPLSLTSRSMSSLQCESQQQGALLQLLQGAASTCSYQARAAAKNA